jgi:hypothetical protein
MLTLAQSRKGIDTPEGLNMAKNRFQLDEKKADKNADGKLSKYEEMTGEAAQKADPDDPELGEKMNLAHGGMPCSCGLGADCGCDGLMSDPLPIGSSPENVADDISAMISQGEYVLPANVVKWHGLKHIMSLQDEAEMGLMMMHDMGLLVEVGGDEEDEYEDHMMYDPETGKGKMTKSFEDHMDLKNKGWSHEQNEAEEPIETPEGNEIELAAVETIYEQPEVDETEEYQSNAYGKTSAYGTMQKPKFTFIV